MQLNTKKNHFDASRELINFLQNYTKVIEMQIAAVHKSMNEAFNSIMDFVMQINSFADEKKVEAEGILSNTYLSPDSITQEKMSSVQNDVNDIIQEQLVVRLDENQNSKDCLRNSRMQQSEKFSKDLESLGSLSDDLSISLLNIMGVLSTEDVIGQRFKHISASITTLTAELSYLLLDFTSRFKKIHISSFEKSMKEFTENQYTFVAEKNLYNKIFQNTSPQENNFAGIESIEQNLIIPFLKFFSQFNLLNKMQIEEVRKEIGNVVSIIMESVMRIDGIIEHRKNSTQISEATPFEELFLEIFKKMTTLILGISGELSIDDIISQRLEHVIKALSGIETFIGIILSDLQNNLTSEKIIELAQSLIKQLLKIYTMPAERDCFLQVFGATIYGKKIC